MPRPYNLTLGEGMTKGQRGLGFASALDDGGSGCYQSVNGQVCVDPSGTVSFPQGFTTPSTLSWIWWLVGGLGLVLILRKR